MDMDKNYNPSLFEDRIYKNWEEKGYFKGIPDKNKKPYCIVIPPPNITGQLHMGHALNNTLQDIMIRYKRMKGYSVLWQPGTDHASIATEVKIVEAMKKEGVSKADIGRDGFLKRAWKWKETYGGRIVTQLKKLGSSCDWSREAFTMDDTLSRAVKKVFISMYNEGIIYRGNRIINWCPCCKTALSDAEVEYEEKEGALWHIKYPIKDSDDYIVIATTRPETLLGDTALAVNPSDTRYTALVGKNVVLPLVNRIIPIIADEYVEKDFGTGVVKITPAHDPNDYEVGLRHNLEVIRIMNDDGTMNENAGKEYVGMDRYDCRNKVVEELKKQGLLLKIEPYSHNVGQCYRCHTVVEPMVSKQWFVSMKPLAVDAIKVVREGDIKFYPQRFEKTYFNWMENVRDWCISRQLWWGHRIPAYYCKDCGELIVAEDTPSKCPKCGCAEFKQDEDVLDTWFSSALWPFSTLGYPDKTEYLDYYYPTNVLITAYDIIFFWVARMIFSGMKHMKEIPFHDVLIHGIVRDAQGRKMSKSLGNGIDPLEIIEKFGADTLRFSLVNGIAPGGDIRYSEEKQESCRNFMNKLWNASRYLLINMEGAEIKPIDKVDLTLSDKWILDKLSKLVASVDKNLDRYEMGLAASNLYDFIWFDFCDRYIEASKTALYSSDPEKKNNALSVLHFVLKNILKLMHPFTPFITTEIYSYLCPEEENLMISDWPTASFDFSDEADRFEKVLDMIKVIRNARAEKNIAPSKQIDINVVCGDNNKKSIEESLDHISKLAGVGKINYVASVNDVDSLNLSLVTEIAEIYIPLGELIDIEKEKERLKTEIEKITKELERSKAMLSNQGFLSKAPETKILQEKEKQAKYEAKYESLIQQLNALK